MNETHQWTCEFGRWEGPGRACSPALIFLIRKQVDCIFFHGPAGWKCQSRTESIVLIPSSFAYLGYDLAQIGAKGLTCPNAASTALILFLLLPKLIQSHNRTSFSYKSILEFHSAGNSPQLLVFISINPSEFPISPSNHIFFLVWFPTRHFVSNMRLYGLSQITANPD